MPLSNLPGPWRWEDRGERGWWRIHDELRIVDGPHPGPPPEEPDAEGIWTYHRFTPDAEGARCLCGHSQDHPSHASHGTEDIPDSLDEVMPVLELGGTIGRRATVECQQGQHDLCRMEISVMEHCDCRCHES